MWGIDGSTNAPGNVSPNDNPRHRLASYLTGLGTVPAHVQAAIFHAESSLRRANATRPVSRIDLRCSL